jgi:hypothetical protein
LDALDGTGLASGDFAITEASGTVYFHKLDPSSGAAESSPDVISPDTNAGDKRWLLVAVTMPDHASNHIKDGSDEVDGDKVDIDWNPSNSTPETVAQTTSVDHLSSHLKGVDVALGLMVPKALFDAQTVLAATTDNTPAAVTLAEQTIVGRKTGGNIAALSATEVRTILNVEDGADVTDAGNIASTIHGVSGKSDAHNNDEVALIDSEASNVLKKITIGELKTEIGTGGAISNVVEDTTPQLGGDLDLNQKSFVYDPTPTNDHAWSGDVFPATAGENVVIGDVCYLKSDGKFWKADADAEATAKGLIVMATASISQNATGVFLRKGFIRDDTWNWTVGAELFVHTTPGNPTATKPSGSGDVVRIVGYAYTADVIWFDPDTAYVEVA